MQEIQQEKDSFERDREVMENYAEGLESEIASLRESIARANDRKLGADRDSVDKTERKAAFAAARSQLATSVRALEEQALARAKAFPRSLLAEPKMAQALEEIGTDIHLTGNQLEAQLPKRLNSILTLLGEAEKFQQTVHLRDELHTRADGREFNMKVVYFGLGAAYAVNEAGDFALVGRPAADGWHYEERSDLAATIKRLVDITTGDAEAGFVPLPVELR
jgi:exonuclease VII small subunit